MNARSRRLLGSAALVLVAGCGGPGEAGSGEVAGDATRSEQDPAVVIAQAIRARPSAKDSILAAHGLTDAGLDSLMYVVAADAERARAYTEAMGRSDVRSR